MAKQFEYVNLEGTGVLPGGTPSKVTSGGSGVSKPGAPPAPTTGSTPGTGNTPATPTTGSATKYSVNYSDPRFAQIESQKQAALSELEQTYGGMINNTDQFYNAQIDASKQWADKQSQLQQEKTDFAIEKIEQEKDKAHKDYLKEQSGAYVDWQKQSNQYGANAENMASQGMMGTGYSESSQVSMYNQYQNRVAIAREAFSQATLNYNNAITEARLQNNSILAEIAAEAYQKQLELALEGFQYKNNLVMDLTDKKMQTDQMYWQRYQDVLSQLNHENSMAEQIRQYNASLAEEKRQFNATLAEQKRQNNSKKSVSSGDDPKEYKFDDGAADSKETLQSVLDLGQGPISAENLAQQVASGLVKETKDENGNTTFEYTKAGLGASLLPKNWLKG